MSKAKEFMKRKDIEISLRRYGIDALGAMAQGLFCSLLIGTILNTLGSQTGVEIFSTVGGYASAMSGPAMAIAIGWALKCPPLVLFSLTAVGWASNALGGAGGPLAVLVVAIVAAEIGKAVSKETPIDVLVTPLVTIFVGVALSAVIAPPIGTGANYVGTLITEATKLQPFWMGIAVSAIVGIALTLPISSAAICSVLGLTGLAGGAAVAGCCANMVGFAVMSFRENRWGGLVSQGLGTSMLQMGNIVRNPKIWIPAIVTSMITGPIATCVFKMEMTHGGRRRQGRRGHRPHVVRLPGPGARVLRAARRYLLGAGAAVPPDRLDKRGRPQALKNINTRQIRRPLWPADLLRPN